MINGINVSLLCDTDNCKATLASLSDLRVLDKIKQHIFTETYPQDGSERLER